MPLDRDLLRRKLYYLGLAWSILLLLSWRTKKRLTQDLTSLAIEFVGQSRIEALGIWSSLGGRNCSVALNHQGLVQQAMHGPACSLARELVASCLRGRESLALL